MSMSVRYSLFSFLFSLVFILFRSLDNLLFETPVVLHKSSCLLSLLRRLSDVMHILRRLLILASQVPELIRRYWLLLLGKVYILVCYKNLHSRTSSYLNCASFVI